MPRKLLELNTARVEIVLTENYREHSASIEFNPGLPSDPKYLGNPPCRYVQVEHYLVQDQTTHIGANFYIFYDRDNYRHVCAMVPTENKIFSKAGLFAAIQQLGYTASDADQQTRLLRSAWNSLSEAERRALLLAAPKLAKVWELLGLKIKNAA